MRGAFAVLVALGLGVGVGYLLGASRGPEVPARTATSQAVTPNPPPQVQPVGDSPLARAIRGIPLPEVARGTGTITGRVKRDDGRPLPGVTIRAILREELQHDRTNGLPPPLDVEAEVRRLIDQIRRYELNKVDAVTAADGTYRLEGLADGRYGLQTYATGYRIRPDGRGFHDLAPGATADFTAEAVVDVEFRVLLPDGTAPPTAMIRLKSGRRDGRQGWRREAPSFSLEPSDYICSATTDDALYTSDEVPVEVREGAPPPSPIVLRLRGRPGICGTVALAPEIPFRRATVWALAFTGDTPPDPQSLPKPGSKDTSATSDSPYQLLDLPPGRYLVGAGIANHVYASRVVEVADRTETCDFRIDAIDPATVIVARVLGPTGDPANDVHFGTGYRVNGSSVSGGGTSARRPDGSYLVFRTSHGLEDGGTYFLRAKSDQYGEKEVEYRKGDAEVVIRFAEPAMLDVLVAGFTESEHAAKLAVDIVPASATPGPFGSHQATPDRDGCVRFGPIESGDYDLLLFVRPNAWGIFVAAKRPVTLAPGTNTLSVPMPTLHTLVVSDPDGKQGAGLTLTPEGATAGMARVRVALDSSLSARFESLPEGAYQLQRDDNTGLMRVTVPPGGAIAFRPTPFNAMRLMVRDGDCPATEAGLKNGDLVIAVDGEEFGSVDDLGLALATLRTKEKATLTLLRGGSRIKVSVNGQDLFRSGASSGVWVEWAVR